MFTTEVSETTCPECGRINNMASSEQEHAPKPGDCSLCIACQTISIFDEALQLRIPTQAECELIPFDQLSRYQRVVSLAKKTTRGNL